MAYEIKSIRYQSNPRKILLQNKNGPCPLLAAANALLLRGVITLSSECVRNGVASTEDVVNMLANRALMRSQQQSSSSNTIANDNDDTDTTTTATTTTSSTPASNHEYHLNEVLSILPTLQHGMDVNPQFFSCESIEYTTNLSALDLLGVELVHGWVLDPQDTESAAVVGRRSYNELIELVICREEVRREVDSWKERMLEKERELNALVDSRSDSVEDEDVGKEEQTVIDENNADTELKALGDANSGHDVDVGKEEQTLIEEDVQIGDAGSAQSSTLEQTDNNEDDGDNESEYSYNEEDPTEQTNVDDKKSTLEQQIVDIKAKLEAASLHLSRADVANAFLTSTSHQLTYHGLEQLHTHIGEDALHVFFRNNHFGTITKHNGILYLLVTDLGYANTPEIIWEKLDSIDGDTEYVNEYFEKPSPRTELAPAAGPTIDPELLLAQRSQAEADYQLAMAMSRGETNVPSASAAQQQSVEDEEGKLIEAAKELSLRTYHGEADATIAVRDNSTTTTTPLTSTQTSQLDSDHQMALAFQRQEEELNHESERLARQLEALDRQEAELQRQRQQRNTTSSRRQRRPAVEETKAGGCIIS